MKTGNPSEPRETFLKKLAYRKASGQGIPGTLSGDFDLSNTRDRLEHLNNTIAHSERLLATDLDKVMEHRFPITDDDLAIDSAIQRALGLMQRARSLGRPEVIDEISRSIRRAMRSERPKVNRYLARLLFESKIGPVNVLALARQLAQDENGKGRTPSEVAAVEDQIPRIEKTLHRYCEQFKIRALPRGRPKIRKDIESDDRD